MPVFAWEGRNSQGQVKKGTIDAPNEASVMMQLRGQMIAPMNVKQKMGSMEIELFKAQPKTYRNRIITEADRWDSTFITNCARRLMRDWVFNPLADEYAMVADWDDRWRTGGTLDDVIEAVGVPRRRDIVRDERSLALGLVGLHAEFVDQGRVCPHREEVGQHEEGYRHAEQRQALGAPHWAHRNHQPSAPRQIYANA